MIQFNDTAMRDLTEGPVMEAQDWPSFNDTYVRMPDATGCATYRSLGGTAYLYQYNQTQPDFSWKVSWAVTKDESLASSCDIEVDGLEADVQLYSESECSGFVVQVRIEGGGTRGNLQFDIGSQGWGYVCDDGFDTDNNAAIAACQGLGYSIGTHFDAIVPDDYAADDVHCPSGSTSMSQCTMVAHSDDCAGEEGIGFECSGPPSDSGGADSIDISHCTQANPSGDWYHLDAEPGWARISVHDTSVTLSAPGCT